MPNSKNTIATATNIFDNLSYTIIDPPDCKKPEYVEFLKFYHKMNDNSTMNEYPFTTFHFYDSDKSFNYIILWFKAGINL